jgi:SAM-dependent methyltransferase
MARKFGCRLVGVDRAQGMIEWARRRARRDHLEGQVEFRQADATSLPFADDRFDAVICESVLAFVPDKRRAVAEFARVARPGAYVGLNEASWVVDPPPDDLVAYLRQVMAGAEFLTPEGWGRLLEAAGLIGIAANAHKVTPLQQWLNGVRSFGLQDAADLLHAWGQFFGLLFRSPEFRAYARGIVPSRKVVRDLFGYLGYGLYIGRKRAGTSSGS